MSFKDKPIGYHLSKFKHARRRTFWVPQTNVYEFVLPQFLLFFLFFFLYIYYVIDVLYFVIIIIIMFLLLCCYMDDITSAARYSPTHIN